MFHHIVCGLLARHMYRCAVPRKKRGAHFDPVVGAANAFHQTHIIKCKCWIFTIRLPLMLCRCSLVRCLVRACSELHTKGYGKEQRWVTASCERIAAPAPALTGAMLVVVAWYGSPQWSPCTCIPCPYQAWAHQGSMRFMSPPEMRLPPASVAPMYAPCT